LKDPYTGKPAGNFLDKNSFVQKLHGHAQEFQIILQTENSNSLLCMSWMNRLSQCWQMHEDPLSNYMTVREEMIVCVPHKT
jgi:hypothetical protein